MTSRPTVQDITATRHTDTRTGRVYVVATYHGPLLPNPVIAEGDDWAEALKELSIAIMAASHKLSKGAIH